MSITSRSDFLSSYINTLEQVTKLNTSITSQQLTSLNSNLSSNILKIFPEAFRLLKKKVTQTMVRITSIQEEFNRARGLYTKNHEKYIKMNRDLEALIKQKNNLINDTSVDERDPQSPPPVEDSPTNSYTISKMFKMSSNSEFKKLSEKIAQNLKDLDAISSSLVSETRRLNMIRNQLLLEISKAYKELEEIELERLNYLKDGYEKFLISFEHVLTLETKHFNQISSTFASSHDSKQELDLFKEKILAKKINPNESPSSASSTLAPSKSLQFLDPTIDFMLEIANIYTQYSEILPSHSLYRIIHQVITIPPSILADADSTGNGENINLVISSNILQLSLNNANEVFSQAELLTTYMTYIQNISKKASSALLEIGENKKGHSKNIQKVLEKHGFKARPNGEHKKMPIITKKVIEGNIENDSTETTDVKTPSGTISSYNSFDPITNQTTSVSILHPSTPRHQSIYLPKDPNPNLCGNLINLTELPDIKSYFEKLVLCIGIVEENELGSYEIINEDICEKFNAIGETINMAKKQLIDQIDSFKTKIETAYGNVKVNYNKLIKIRNLIRDKKATISRVNGGGNEEGTSAPSTSSTFSFTRNLESIGSSFRNANLKQVVGLEKTSDRVNRLESDIQGLEQQQIELIQNYCNSYKDLLCELINVSPSSLISSSFFTSSFSSTLVTEKDLSMIDQTPLINTSNKPNNGDLYKNVETTLDFLYNGLESLHKILSSLVSSQDNGLQLVQNSILRMKEESKNFNPNNDVQFLLKKILNEVNSTSTLILLDIPTIEPFQPLKNDSIEEERKILTQQGIYQISSSTTNTTENFEDFNEDKKTESDRYASPVREERNSEENLNPFATPAKSNISLSTAQQLASSVSATSSSSTSGPDHELKKFGLSITHKVIESFSCAIYPKNMLLNHGRLYVTQNYLAFSGWPELRVLIPLAEVSKVEKSTTLGYIPNAITIKMKDNSDYFFASFIDRELCYNLIVRLSQIAKSVVDLRNSEIEKKKREGNEDKSDKDDDMVDDYKYDQDGKPLEFGYQIITTASSMFRNTLMTTNSMMGLTSSKEKIENNNKEKQQIESFDHDSEKDEDDEESESEPEAEQPTGSTEDDDAAAEDSTLPNVFNLSTVFGKQVSILTQDEFPVSARNLFLNLWLNFKDYKEYVEAEGDFDVKHEEWLPISAHKKNAQYQQGDAVGEDVLKIPFTHTRNQTFLHPRTSMLMFGPKDAPAQQRQYLYLPTKKALEDSKREVKPNSSGGEQENEPESQISVANLKKTNPKHGAILIITQFDGIPMADVFRVCQYWTFEELAPNKTILKVGVAIHYVKYTMLKSQILSGTKEEMGVGVKNYMVWARKRLASVSAVALPSKTKGKKGKIEEPPEIAKEEPITQISQPTPAPAPAPAESPIMEILKMVPGFEMVNDMIPGGVGTIFIVFLVLYLFFLNRKVNRLSGEINELKNLINLLNNNLNKQ